MAGRCSRAVAIVFVLLCLYASVGVADKTRRTFTLWQLPNQSRIQMMSYVIRTVQDKIVVIDGGTVSDAPYLRDFLKKQGGHVDLWFITHPHDDHHGALCGILKEPQGVEIDRLYASMPDAEWVAANTGDSDRKEYAALMAALEGAHRAFTDLSLGQKFRLDGIHIEVLGVRNPEITTGSPLNNSSVVLRVSDRRKSVLFLADLGAASGDKLLASPYANSLHCDYVQMAHHGQNGVSEAFYKKVSPRYCLWPAPQWLWDNDSGQGKGSGRWRTLETRAWMEKLHVERNYVLVDGLVQID